MRVLLTGASGSLGSSIIESLISENNAVDCIVRDPTYKNDNCENIIYSDLSSRESIDSIVLPSVHYDAFIHVAGFNPVTPFSEVSYDTLLNMFHIYQYAPIHIIRSCLLAKNPLLQLRVVNISSIWAIHGCSHRLPYGMNKAALDSLTRHLAAELASEGVLLNSVLPGFLDTNLTSKTQDDPLLSPFLSRIPTGSIVEPSSIVPFILNLVSPTNTYITGQSFVLDGGLLVSS